MADDDKSPETDHEIAADAADRDDEDFQLRDDLLDRIHAAIENEDSARLNDLLEPMHAADIADVIEQLSSAERRAFLHLYSGEIDGEILSEIDEGIREEVLEQLPRAVL
ncbi:MAG: magnesium transporter MgtE N-terminal domain-containing protein, partial [Paracoccus sp. (in: a-proteobacteria)]